MLRPHIETATVTYNIGSSGAWCQIIGNSVVLLNKYPSTKNFNQLDDIHVILSLKWVIIKHNVILELSSHNVLVMFSIDAFFAMYILKSLSK